MSKYWAIRVAVERYETERLFHHETLELPAGVDAGDGVVLVADTDPPVVFGLARADAARLRYTRRFFDKPQPADGLELDGPIDESTYARFVTPPSDRREWLVSVDLPIEAESAAEAVREFWTYVTRLGPRELPAYVAPLDDELAMQAYVLGEETDLDPED